MKKLALFLLTLLVLGALTACKEEKTVSIVKTGEDAVTRDYAVNSNNIVMTQDGNTIFTANMDVHSVTFIDAKKNKVMTEIPVGKEPRQLTLSPDERFIFVTCMFDNKVDIISVEKKKVIQSIEVGIEPYGVVTSQDGKTLYVANYRSSTISVIDLKSLKVEREIAVDDRPRTIAMAAEGNKLYVPQYLTGDISVIDLDSNKVTNVIELADSPDQRDAKKSQGIPNTLEQFVISPDGKTAWIPHLLTNIDTPIHFEETIFPAISIVDLQKEEELLEERKELFKEMNVKDNQNQTMIVANPYDVVFHPNGSKAFVAMSGSEDLVVFDLKRGGNATQVLRRIEGDNPRGMVISPSGETIYTHNAMSHDLAKISTGGDNAYARAKMEGDNLPLIEKDSLSPLEREGKTIFYSANSEEFEAGITGNNWMSCASCHADGDMNGMTLTTAKGPRNIPSNVVTTKTGLFLWDGSRDDFTDYLLTVQGEMGGMTEYDPGKPLPKEVEHMYDAVFAFLDNPNSFPPPKSPYRTDEGELSASAREGKELFEGKAGCISCHGGKEFTDSAKAIGDDGNLTTDNTQFLHDIGTSNQADRSSKGDARAGMKNPRDNSHFDTPTLRGVWATAPYFHDGSAKTIEEAITRHQKETQGLTQGEIAKIAEYVRSIE
ncbi:cytochrome D1 domain-containing protein [Peribacillus alkalitolerans]|uniref:cytochrome D1 domain-containing protein n=1 Tax=Peribacillus alkalitolerans TaxID=1550385 RepID=UPI0013D8150F|nr:cytochrome D1 domain-containing protein [Peribacillus alkalitolerans]